MLLSFILAQSDNTLFYLVPLAIGISLVYSASRYEMTSRILARAVRLCFTIVGFMALVLVVLMTLHVSL
jgi:hypothetical protein